MESQSLKMPSGQMSVAISQQLLHHTLGGDGSDCCVCGKFLLSSPDGSAEEETAAIEQRIEAESERHFCGKICNGLFAQALTFVQGFLLGNFLCIIRHGEESIHSHSPFQSFSVMDERRCESLCVKEEPISSIPLSLTSDSTETGESVSSLKLEENVSIGPLAVEREAEDAVKTHKQTFQSNCRSDPGRSCSSTDSVSDNLAQTGNHLVCEGSFSPGLGGCKVEQSCDHVSSESGGKNVSGMKKLSVRHKTLETLTCFQCGKTEKSETSLKTHIKQQHKQNIMLCRICGKRCAGRIGLTMHANSRHRGEKAVECETCGEQFFNSSQYNKHQTKVHGKERGICHVCGKHFRSSAALQAHIQVHLGMKQYVCEHCGKVFSRITSLITHRKLHLGSGGRKRRCNVCQGELSQGQCPEHPHSRKRTLSGGASNWLKCRECEQSFDNMQALERHAKQHEEDRNCVCNVCGKSFKMAHHLIVHKQQHREKRFRCDLCQKAFTYKCNMQKHRETHTQERAFECDVCHKTFKTKGVMEKHKVMHDEALQFRCHLCSKGVITKHNLKKHYRKMHPDHPEAVL